jgi:hypothetical protein
MTESGVGPIGSFTSRSQDAMASTIMYSRRMGTRPRPGAYSAAASTRPNLTASGGFDFKKSQSSVNFSVNSRYVGPPGQGKLTVAQDRADLLMRSTQDRTTLLPNEGKLPGAGEGNRRNAAMKRQDEAERSTAAVVSRAQRAMLLSQKIANEVDVCRDRVLRNFHQSESERERVRLLQERDNMSYLALSAPSKANLVMAASSRAAIASATQASIDSKVEIASGARMQQRARESKLRTEGEVAEMQRRRGIHSARERQREVLDQAARQVVADKVAVANVRRAERVENEEGIADHADYVLTIARNKRIEIQADDVLRREKTLERQENMQSVARESMKERILKAEIAAHQKEALVSSALEKEDAALAELNRWRRLRMYAEEEVTRSAVL